MKRNTMSPPAWAERALVTLLPVDRAESESGDLLEAYRDEQLPARGRLGADWWYVRQVALVFTRNYSFWVIALVAQFVIADVSNAYRFASPLRIVPGVGIGLALAACLHAGWRSARISGGLLAGAVTCTLLWLFMAAWWLTTWYPFAFVQQVEPYWINAWQSSAAPGESFMHWIFWDNVGATIMSGLVISASGLVLGLVGGMVGSTARKLKRA